MSSPCQFFLTEARGSSGLSQHINFSLSSHLIPREYNSGLEQTPFYLGSFLFVEIPVEELFSSSSVHPIPRSPRASFVPQRLLKKRIKDTYIKYLYSIQLYNWFHALLSVHLLPSVQLGSGGGKCREDIWY